MRYILGVALILLLFAGSALFFYWHGIWGWWLILGVPFAERAVLLLLWRAGFFLLFLVVGRVMPISARHAYARMATDGRRTWYAYSHHAEVFWLGCPWPLRIVLAAFGAIAAAVCAFVLLELVPGSAGEIPLIGPWLRDIALPCFTRSATFKMIVANVPEKWKLRIKLAMSLLRKKKVAT